MYMDVKLEAIMPRVIIESSHDHSLMQKDRPNSMQVQVSRFAITNIREMGASRADLAQAVHSLQEGSLVFSTGFPSVPEDLNIVTDRILSHIAATDVMTSSPLIADSNLMNTSHMSRYALWNDTRDVWCVKIDPVWIDFLGARSIGVNRSVPFIDAVPVTLWIHGKSNIEENLAERVIIQQEAVKIENNLVESWMLTNQEYSKQKTATQMANPFGDSNHKRESNPFILSASNLMTDSTNKIVYEETTRIEPNVMTTDDKSANIHVIAHFGNLVSIQLDHYQLLFLLRFLEEVNELTTYLTMDSRRITQEMSSKQSVIIGCVLPQCEITLVMPSQTPGKESSGCGDGESVLPDSASLGDDLHTHNSGWHQHGSLNPFSSIESPSPSKQDKFDFPSSSEQPKVVTQNNNTIKFNIPNDNDSPQTINANQISSSSSSSTSTIKNKSKTSGDSISIIPKELNTGLNQMRKGFSKFMTSIDSVLPSNSSFDDGSDTLSIQSDISDDSELFVVLGDTTTDGHDFMFKLNPDNKLAPVEVASEVCEDPFLTNLSSPSEPSESSSIKRRDLVSMITFR